MPLLALAPAILAGMATAYVAHTPNAPLWCDGRLPGQPAGALLFDQVLEPWVALDVSEYVSGRARCGDDILLRVTLLLPGGGTEIHTMRARALDAGPLYPYTVLYWDGQSRTVQGEIAETGLPIVVDIPRHHAPFSGLSAPAIVINVSAMRRYAAEVLPQ
jgi:hypothetical protein